MKSNLFAPLKPLAAGSRVALVAPSGFLSDPAHVERACANVTSLGWSPVLGANVRAVHGYLAGTDEQRLADFNLAVRDESIDAIWCVRGGYGAMRLLAGIDYASLRTNPRPVIGFSDITALHAAIHRECRIVSFHGPTARGQLSDISRDSLVRALSHQDSCGTAERGRVLRSGRAVGRLAGGNLALVASLMGTPYSVDFEGAILVLEDIDEAVYRVDRMLRQLVLSGALSRCVAIVAGDFRPPAGEKSIDGRTVDDVIAEAADEAGIPCLAGAPFGHIADQWTLPLGAVAELDTSDMSLHVTRAAT
ncbi:MAG TPA: LD-carboxypeptidase [Gemmatimonadaceae bacterium]|nr:LD-carboxypeptidase [Gemmatimonadaceae bacterium]